MRRTRTVLVGVALAALVAACSDEPPSRAEQVAEAIAGAPDPGALRQALGAEGIDEFVHASDAELADLGDVICDAWARNVPQVRVVDAIREVVPTLTEFEAITVSSKISGEYCPPRQGGPSLGDG